MNSQSKPLMRCAIYTRKSSEEGLEQSFNSLDAQREASEAFIVSQRHEGWRVIPTHYDDGGYSGGNMERPALKQLLADVAANKIDVIVVYKVDRLTRSLADFAKIVEAFDARGVSFVSVTQQFNTTTSMGRLTLNILLSFAQFEREVTGERIRDKVAASKRKGMWMGGNVPLGYDVRDQKLIVNPTEAELVLSIFSRYLELGCVSKLKSKLDEEGITSKVRTSSGGVRSGGKPFARGGLYKILNNRIYLGEISHKGQCYPGEHDPIVPRQLWDRVQAQLRSDNQGRRNGLKTESVSLLTGLVQDFQGNRLTASHTVKNGRRYRYYACQTAPGKSRTTGSSFRLPAYDIEARVLSRFAGFLSSKQDVMDGLGLAEDDAELTQQLLASTPDMSRLLRDGTRHEVFSLVKSVIYRVIAHQDKVEVLINKPFLRRVLLKGYIAGSSTLPLKTDEPAAGDLICLEFAARLRRVGREVRLVVPPNSAETMPSHQNPALVKAIARANDWREQLIAGEVSGPRSIAKQTGLDESYVRRILGLAFLAPDIVEVVLHGRQPEHLTLEKLRTKFPMNWVEQRLILLSSAYESKNTN